MANKKINQLVAKTTIQSTDLFPIGDATTGTLFKKTIADLQAAIGGAVISVNGLVGTVVLDTDDILELPSPTNKYFTEARARAAISLTTSGSSGASTYSSSTGVLNVPTYTLAGLGGITASFLSGGTGITYNSTTGVIAYSGTVYTDSSVRNLFSGSTGISYNSSTGAFSSTITQYTDALARASISGTAPITYNSTTGAIGITQASGSTNGFLSSTDWNTFNNKQSTLTNPTTGTGTTNTIAKFTGTSALGNSNITDNGTSVSIGGSGNVNINNFISGSFSRTLPTGNTFAGQTLNITGSENGWGLVNRNTWNLNDDAFTTSGFSIYDNRLILSRSTTASIGWTIFQSFILNNGTASQSATGYISQSAGTGNFSSFIGYKIGATGPINNTNSYTNYYGLDMGNTPNNNVTNYYGVNINDFTGTSLSRALNLSLAAGTNKWNIYAGGTANNFMAGSLGIGTTFPNSRLDVQSNGFVASFGESGNQIRIYSDIANQDPTLVTSSGKNLRIEAGGIFGMMIRTSGNTLLGTTTDNGEKLYVSGNIRATGTITANSDINLKKNLLKIENALEKVEQINGYTYEFKSDDSKRHAGVIAQEIEGVLPEIVNKGNDGLLGVEYGNISALLIEAIKDLKSQNESLVARLEALEK
jgi:hypothetical protein